MQVQGDAFLARVFDNEDDFERLDFTLKEVTSSAPWVKEAAAQNEAKRKGDQADTILRRMQVTPTSSVVREGMKHLRSLHVELLHGLPDAPVSWDPCRVC